MAGQDTAKIITPAGVVIVRNAFDLLSTVPGPDKGATGITSYIVVKNGDTEVPVTQLKFDVWKDGRFELHDHGGAAPMGEFFVVLRGKVQFRYGPVDGPFDEVELGEGGCIYFPPGVFHTGRNAGEEDAMLMVIGVRAGITHPCDDGQKGINIPAV